MTTPWSNQLRWYLLGCSVLALAGCGSDEKATDGGRDSSVTREESGSGRQEAGAKDWPSSAEHQNATDGSGNSEIQNDFGFVMRTPQAKRTIECPNPPGQPVKSEFPDADWICTFVEGSISGHLYVQSTPTSCASTGMFGAPVYTTGVAEIAVSGKRTALTGAQYDYGGGHHNDFLEFDYSGKHYKYYHSSFGFGWRRCQPMDCMIVYQSKGGATITDGCTSPRALPVVCLEVEQGESYGVNDFKDTFQKCPGDSNP